MITSRSNAQLKSVRRLLDSSKERRERKLFVVEGKRLVGEAPAEWVEEVFVSETFYSFGKTDLSPYKKVEIVKDDVFKSVSATVHPQGILAVVRQPEYLLKGFSGSDAPVGVDTPAVGDAPVGVDIPSADGGPSGAGGFCTILLLDDIQDPGNLGTMFRTAEAAGVSGVIMSSGCADIFNPKAIRSTMGSIYRLPFIVDELVPAIENLKMDGFQVYGAALEEAVPFREIDYPRRRAIVIGNEGKGISTSVLNSVNERIFIPMKGQVESLNAAVSCAVLLYHLDGLL